MMGMYCFQGYGSGISSDDEVHLQRGTRANGTLHDEVEEFAGTEGFRGFEEHRVGNIEDKINEDNEISDTLTKSLEEKYCKTPDLTFSSIMDNKIQELHDEWILV